MCLTIVPPVDNFRIEILGIENGVYSFGEIYWENEMPVYWELSAPFTVTAQATDDLGR